MDLGHYSQFRVLEFCFLFGILIDFLGLLLSITLSLHIFLMGHRRKEKKNRTKQAYKHLWSIDEETIFLHAINNEIKSSEIMSNLTLNVHSQDTVIIINFTIRRN